ncbi:hypothetical protein C900_02096 [Fulvivirga imtechensis AK7]|uniref:Uncharacterized protein n=1 Tax=Fulvivirga imtechensis AK7 TaxID=1237149 RepID=L8K2L2_9BACT|nr:hypothetical protein [Fulvivirga imtechensis]ELR73692.1 hypothetical protein C900_02096 [Fulvivirga imtechensis AK7]
MKKQNNDKKEFKVEELEQRLEMGRWAVGGECESGGICYIQEF